MSGTTLTVTLPDEDLHHRLADLADGPGSQVRLVRWDLASALPADLAADVRSELALGEEKTAANTGMLFNIALNYGGRAEIVEAAKRLIEAGVSADELDEDRFAGFLYTAGQPDPDLLIRTSGEMRVSNFLLWQIAYAEIWVTETLWPDFRRRDLLEAVLAYQKRDRRYGGIKASPVALGVK